MAIPKKSTHLTLNTILGHLRDNGVGSSYPGLKAALKRNKVPYIASTHGNKTQFIYEAKATIAWMDEQIADAKVTPVPPPSPVSHAAATAGGDSFNIAVMEALGKLTAMVQAQQKQMDALQETQTALAQVWIPCQDATLEQTLEKFDA